MESVYGGFGRLEGWLPGIGGDAAGAGTESVAEQDVLSADPQFIAGCSVPLCRFERRARNRSKSRLYATGLYANVHRSYEPLRCRVEGVANANQLALGLICSIPQVQPPVCYHSIARCYWTTRSECTLYNSPLRR